MELAKGINVDLYPEVGAAGDLSNALGKALADVGSPLQAAAQINFIPFARTESGSRFCQMYIAAHERLFIFDFWFKGVSYGRGSSSSLNEAAQAMHFWIIEQPDIAQMQKRFSFFEPEEKAIAHEAGRAVEFQWERLLKTWARDETNRDAISPLPLIEAAMKQPELRQLYPFTSLYTLHFSRTTGYPFTNDCPFAGPIGNGRFRVYRPSPPMSDPEHMGEVIGEGNAEETVAMLVSNLPPNCGPAVEGTATDLPEQS